MKLCLLFVAAAALVASVSAQDDETRAHVLVHKVCGHCVQLPSAPPPVLPPYGVTCPVVAGSSHHLLLLLTSLFQAIDTGNEQHVVVMGANVAVTYTLKNVGDE